MNRGYYEGVGRINSGLFLRRGRLPRQHNIHTYPHQGFVINGFGGGGISPINLTNAYSFGVSGSVQALRFLNPYRAYLTEFDFVVTSQTGTPGNLTIQLRAGSATNPSLLPDSVLLASQTLTPTANSWNRVIFSTPALLDVNKTYFLIVGDPAGSATNYWSMLARQGGVNGSLGGAETNYWAAVNTTNGFSTNGTAISSGFVACIRWSNGQFMGMENFASGTYASDTSKRGILIGPMEIDCEVYGVRVGSSTSWDAIEIYDDITGPLSPPLYRQTVTADNRSVLACYFERPFRLRAGKSYRIVCTVSANSSMPGQQNIWTETGKDSILRQLNMFGDRVRYTYQSGSTGNVWITGGGSFHMNILARRFIDPRV